MPRKRKAISPAAPESKRNAIVTVDGSSMSLSSSDATVTSIASRIRGECVVCKGALDECVYHIMMQENDLILASLSLEVFDSMVGTLKLLVPIAPIATNMHNKHATSVIASTIAEAKRVVACGANVLYFVVRDLKSNPFNVVIHYGSLDLHRKGNENVRSHLGEVRQIHIVSSSRDAAHFTDTYTLSSTLRPTVQSRMAVARKLYKLSLAQAALDRRRHSDASPSAPAVDAATRLSLQNKLRILLQQSSAPSASNESSKKFLREKMTLLGMLSSVDGGSEHPDADRGRCLALTRWMDCAKGTAFGADFGIIRQGASADGTSFAIRENIAAFRQIVSAYSCRKEAVKSEEEASLLPRKRRHQLQMCRVVGIGWRPNPAGDDDQWGGCYGKSCAHNEVVMHFLRPFHPMEVINTHICSKDSPAPGNETYEGCLEFLQAQCRWKRRAATVWDTTHFHFVSKTGQHSAFPKDALLALPLAYLKIIVQNLRAMTIETCGQVQPDRLLVQIDAYMRLYCMRDRIGELQEHGPVQRKIASYLLHGSSGSLGKAAKNYVVSLRHLAYNE